MGGILFALPVITLRAAQDCRLCECGLSSPPPEFHREENPPRRFFPLFFPARGDTMAPVLGWPNCQGSATAELIKALYSSGTTVVRVKPRIFLMINVLVRLLGEGAYSMAICPLVCVCVCVGTEGVSKMRKEGSGENTCNLTAICQYCPPARRPAVVVPVDNIDRL